MVCTPHSPSPPTPPSRRALLTLLAGSAAAAATPAAAATFKFEPMAGLEGKDYGKPRTVVEDYTSTPTGLQYKDLVDGDLTSSPASPGDAVTMDWDGYTLGYYGRPFEARNKAKGGSFDKDKDYLRFIIGDGSVIPGFDEAVTGMRVGGVRRVVVPVELGYPDGEFDKVGPKPATFSGRRALSFVLKNQGLIDKTLLFNVELLRVAPKK